VRAGITRYTVGNKLKAEGFDLASLGFPASTIAVFNGARYFPTFSPSGVASLSGGGGDSTANNTFFVQPTYTKARGRHILNAGYDVRAYRTNAMPANSDAGSYTFGVQGANIDDAMEYLKKAEDLGPDALIAMPPTEAKTGHDFRRYYATLAGATKRPLLVQTSGGPAASLLRWKCWRSWPQSFHISAMSRRRPSPWSSGSRHCRRNGRR